MSIFFNGRLITSPATVSRVDDSALANSTPGSANVVALIGKAVTGTPLTALRFGSPQEARAALTGGELLKAIEKAFDPSPEVPGASTVVVVRVDPATQATLPLNNAANAPVITLTSSGYGRPFNAVKVKIENGTVTGKKISVAMGAGFFTGDNLARRSFSTTYTGANATATIAITQTQVILTDAAVTTIELSDHGTVQGLVDRISAVPGWGAAVLDGNGAKGTLNTLDSLAAVNAKGVTVEAHSDLAAIVDWFNGIGENYVDAVRVAGAGDVPANIPYTYLSGATSGNVTNTQWQSAFDVLQAEDVRWVVPVSSDPSIHAMASAHCTFMSDVGRRERRAFVGGAVGTSDVNAIAAATVLNSDRVAYVHLGFYDYDPAGALVLYPPYIMAALVAGAFSGVNPGTPLTNKAIKVQGLERKLRNPTDTDPLVRGGVLTFESTPSGYRVVQSISTWLTNANFNRREISTGVALDFVARSVRDAVDTVRGAKGSPQALSDAASRADTVLRALSVPEPNGPGVLVGDAQNPAYKNITARLDGDALSVSFQCSPGIPINYVLVSIYAQPWSGSASVSLG